jgi:MarR family transcriptional regulator, organic hydroperoxide resistance regulator
MPDTLSPDRVYFRFVRLTHRLSGEMARRLKQASLSIPQFDMLSTLSEQEGLSQSDLATRLYVTKGNVSGLVDRLVEAGYVERRSTPGDRRSHALYLTGTGRKAAEDGIRIQKEFVSLTLGNLSTDDLVSFDRVLMLWRDSVRQAQGRKS